MEHPTKITLHFTCYPTNFYPALFPCYLPVTNFPAPAPRILPIPTSQPVILSDDQPVTVSLSL
jgi:hypothetical protein